jgi:hypothetical protein
MSNLNLQCKDSSKPHPEGVHNGVCVDVIDLGLVETDFQGEHRTVPKVRLVFETEALDEAGKRCTISKTFTASLHPKAKLAEFLTKWRGRPVVPGESIDLTKLLGVSCTLVTSHQQNLVGRTYGSIDAISKPSKKVTPSGQYDPAAMRRKIEEFKAGGNQGGGKSMSMSADVPCPTKSVAAPAPQAPGPSRTGQEDFDPEVGF